MQNKLTSKLEDILEKTLNVLNNSKTDIFSIYESACDELENIENEIKLINQDIKKIIDKMDKVKTKNRKARNRLMEVSRDIKVYTEKDIKKAYKKAEDTSVEIAVLEEKEEQLKDRRKELEKRAGNLRETVNKTENLISKVGLVKEFLQGELDSLSAHIEDIKEKQQVVMKVIEAQEEERKRVAREIHDGPAQSLANLVFRCEYIQKIIDDDLKQAKEELSELKGLIHNGVQNVRKVIYDLRPMSLDDLGLIPTLKKYINKFEKQTDLEVDLKIKGTKSSLSSSFQITIFRLVQEALNNIYKHAQADSSKVCVKFSKEQIKLLIIDDGRGFNKEEVSSDKFGLVSMRERCELVGGNIKIDSKKNRGTKVEITIPFTEEDA